MGTVSRQIREQIRRIACRWKTKPTPSEEQRVLSEIAMSAVAEKIPQGEFNKTVWMFWDSGLETAPDVVRLSYQSWTQYNPDYHVVLLDRENIKNHLGFDFYAIFDLISVDLGAAGKSDLLRLYLLNRFGGVWADATTFCRAPLSTWLPIDETGFFSFREKHADDRTLVSWFLASKPGHPIVQTLLEEAVEYLAKPRTVNLDVVGLKVTELIAKGTTLIGKTTSGNALLGYLEQRYCAPYFWMFYLFNEIVAQPSHQLVWQSVLTTTNCHAELDEAFSIYQSSYVSKQTYRDRYTSADLYQQRVNDICQQLEAITVAPNGK